MPAPKRTVSSYPEILTKLLLQARHKPINLTIPDKSKAYQMRQELYTLRKKLAQAQSPVAELTDCVAIRIKALTSDPDGPQSMTLEPRFYDFVALIERQHPELGDFEADDTADTEAFEAARPLLTEAADPNLTDIDPLADFMQEDN